MERDSELNMLSFYAVRGIDPVYIMSLSVLERGFYYRAMELWYKEKNEAFKLLGQMLGVIKRV